MKIFIVALVHDREIFRLGVVKVLEFCPGVSVLGHFNDYDELVTTCESEVPEIILFGIEESFEIQIVKLENLVRNYPSVRIVVLFSPRNVFRLTKIIQAGACACLSSRSTESELRKAIHDVCKYGIHLNCYFTIDILQKLILEKFDRRSYIRQSLTDREREILQLIYDENSNSEIALLLNISIRTVENHRKQIKSKTGARNTAGLVKYAIYQQISGNLIRTPEALS